MALASTERTDEQQAIIEMVRQFVDEQIIPKAEHYDGADEYPEPIVEQMKELGPLRGHDPRGVRRDGPGPDDLHDDRRGAQPRLDLDLRRRQHALHRLLPADEVRHGRAEGAAAAAHGHRRDPRRLLALGARARLRRPGHQVHGHEDGRRRLRDQRPEDVGHERAHVRHRLRARQDRPRGRSALQGHDLLHLREGARRLREPGPHRPAEDQEARLQGRRVHRARLRRLPLPRRHDPRRRGGRPRPGLQADDGRARGRAG